LDNPINNNNNVNSTTSSVSGAAYDQAVGNNNSNNNGALELIVRDGRIRFLTIGENIAEYFVLIY
jgi:hypothetical protein